MRFRMTPKSFSDTFGGVPRRVRTPTLRLTHQAPFSTADRAASLCSSFEAEPSHSLPKLWTALSTRRNWVACGISFDSRTAAILPVYVWKSILRASHSSTISKWPASEQTPMLVLSRSEEHTSELQSQSNIVC